MSTLIIDNKKVEYTIVRTKRKTIGIRISAEGNIVVSAPNKCSINTVEKIVSSKGSWIISKLEQMLERNKNFKAREFKAGEKISLLGKEYDLDIAENNKNKGSATFNGMNFVVSVDRSVETNERKKRIEESLKTLMKRIAREILASRTQFYAEQMRIEFGKISIKEQKSIWGSCSSRNNLNYNWKIIMAPIEIVDYIVVHELCHIKVRNHSQSYWEQVGAVLSDYNSRRTWLKENGYKLNMEHIYN